LSERTHSRFEKLGNGTYALAILIIPIYGGLFLSALLADLAALSQIAWAAPAVAIGLGIGWLIASQVLAWRIRRRLGEQDRQAKMDQLAKAEMESLDRAQALYHDQHYDLSIIEAFRALEARLRQALPNRRITSRVPTPRAVIQAATKKGILREPALSAVEELRRHWSVAVSNEPLSRQDATDALDAVRRILSIVPGELPNMPTSLPVTQGTAAERAASPATPMPEKKPIRAGESSHRPEH
jgi:hypothetical protein